MVWSRNGQFDSFLDTLSCFDHWLQFDDLQECYLQKRRQLANQTYDPLETDTDVIRRDGYNAGLVKFQSVLSTFTRYRYGFKNGFSFGSSLLNQDYYSAPTLLLICIFLLFSNSRLRVIAELRHGEHFHSANIVSRFFFFYYIYFDFIKICKVNISGNRYELALL